MAQNWLDRAIGYVAPEAALRRAAARVRMDVMFGAKRSYDAAKTGRRTDGWYRPGTSANAEVVPAMRLLMASGRELVRNNPYAAKAVMSLAGDMVGCGIQAQATGASDRQHKAAEAAWLAFCEDADADGLDDFNGLQHLATRTMMESGAALLRYRYRSPKDGLAVPLQVQVLEPDFIDTSKTGMNGDNEIVAGIEFNPLGKRVAYWLFDQHPGEIAQYRRSSYVSKRVPANRIEHMFDRLRPGQDHGVSIFAPVAINLHDFGDYLDADLLRKKLEACVVGIVTGDEGPAQPTMGAQSSDSTADRRIEEFEPGMFEYLATGQTVNFNNPNLSANFGEYATIQLHAIAAGLGTTYERLTGDLTGVNYSSYRAGALPYRRLVEVLRNRTVIRAMCRGTWRRVQAVAYATGQVNRADTKALWIAPAWPSVDPAKDEMANLLAMRLGRKTLNELAAENGRDAEDLITEWTALYAKIDAAGLVFDFDGRRMSRAGNPSTGGINAGNGDGSDGTAGDGAGNGTEDAA